MFCVPVCVCVFCVPVCMCVCVCVYVRDSREMMMGLSGCGLDEDCEWEHVY